MSATKDFTKGKPAKQIFLFSLPLMLGNVFQQLYTMVDTIVVGQGVGVEALASLGATDWLNWLVLGLLTGLTQGFAILFSQCYGANDQKNLQKAVGNALSLTMVAAVVLLVAAQLSIVPILRVLQTPENIFGGAKLYLRIVFAGIPIILFYNFASALLRSLGDSRAPFVALVVASVINIVLDILFVMGFHWGIAGAATATVLAQGVSLIYCVFVVRRIQILQISRDTMRIERQTAGRLLFLGVPVMFQNTIISVGGMFIQSIVNGFGFLFVAGFTAANKLYGLLETAGVSYGYAITTYVAQNYGAGDFKRIKKGMRSGTMIAVGTSVLVSVLMIVFGENILKLFISAEPDQAEQVLTIAKHCLYIMSAFLSILYVLHVHRSGLMGIGDTVTPMASGIMELLMRVVAGLTFPVFMGQEGIFYGEILAWAGAAVLQVVVYYIEIGIKSRKYEGNMRAEVGTED